MYVGAIGDPRVEPGLVDSIIVRVRFAFDEYVNFRMVKLLEGIPSPILKKGHRKISISSCSGKMITP